MSVRNVKDKNEKNIIITALSVMVILFAISLTAGKYPISAGRIICIITGKADASVTRVFYYLRLPRCLMTFFVGAALGISGSVYQTIFRNPLASPDLIGVSAGANLGSAAAIVIFSGAGFYFVIVSSFAGGICAAGAVLFMAKCLRSRSTSTYILAGIMINAVCAAALMALKYFADSENELSAIEFWEMGSFGSVTLVKFLYILPVFFAGICGILLLSRQIVMLSLGDDEARSLGVRIKSIRTSVLLINTLLTSAAVCATGLISFVGLTAPHISGLLIKRNGMNRIVLAGIVGAILVSTADMLVRLLPVAEFPVSIITTAVGIPFLAAFLIKKEKNHDNSVC